jgi:hypothetical protein
MTLVWAGVAFAVVTIVAIVAGVAFAGVPEPDYGGHAIGTIRSIDRADNVVTLADGLRLRATDGQVLEDLHEGDLVKVDFAHESGGWVIRTIEGAQADTEPTDSGGE